MTRVLLVEDHAVLRRPLAQLLSREPDLEVEDAGTIADARVLLSECEVDVLVVDLGLPDGDGRELIGEYLKGNPLGRALVLSSSTDPYELAEAVEAGAAGVLHKVVEPCEMVDAVRRLAGGGLLLSPEQIREMIGLSEEHRSRRSEARTRLEHLTPRELEVLSCVAEGLDDKGLSSRLGISEKTVRIHMSSIFSKLGVQSRTQAAIFALRHGVVRS